MARYLFVLPSKVALCAIAIALVSACHSGGGTVPMVPEALSPKSALTGEISTVGFSSPSPSIYVNNGTNVEVFPLTANGNVHPAKIITGMHPSGKLALDATYHLYVASGCCQVDVFAAGAVGAASPVRIIKGSNTTLGTGGFNGSSQFSYYAIALAADGTTYVLDPSYNVVDVFAPGANGNTAPVRTMTYFFYDPPEFTVLTGMALDTSGKLFVVQQYTGSSTDAVHVFLASTNGSTAPLHTIYGYCSPVDVAVDHYNHIYVTESGCRSTPDMREYWIDSTGHAHFMREIYGPPSTNFAGIAVDSSGKIYISEHTSSTNAIAVYAATASGSATPIRTVRGSYTGLSSSFRYLAVK